MDPQWIHPNVLANIKGIATAPFAAAAGSVLAATPAHAATIDAGQFSLTSRSSNGHGEFAALTAGLATKLTNVGATTVVADTHRSATRLTSAPSTAEAFQAGFAFDSDDQAVDYWIPQGVTTSADAYGNGLYPDGGSNKVVLVSWYFETDQPAVRRRHVQGAAGLRPEHPLHRRHR